MGLIGPKGTGKTTLFNCVAGFFAPSASTVKLDGQAISGLPPEARTRAGVGPTFLIARTFSRMTARKNVLSGALPHRRHVGRARAAAMQWQAFRQPGPLRRQAFAPHDLKRPER